MKDSNLKKRLSKFLAAAGIASRRACEDLIFSGKVTVNGTVTLLPQTLVDENDKVVCNGKNVTCSEQKVYYILNKPKGYVCTSAHSNSNIVLDLFGDVKERLFTIGRLDKDTKGLLLVTNDGHFANRVIHPSGNIQKEYLAKTNHEITPEHLLAISSGTLVEGTFVKPLKVVKIRRGTLKITISEGKKREIRQLLESAGLRTLDLTRIRIGGLVLGSLPEGSWRPLKPREMELIFKS